MCLLERGDMKGFKERKILDIYMRVCALGFSIFFSRNSLSSRIYALVKHELDTFFSLSLSFYIFLFMSCGNTSSFYEKHTSCVQYTHTNTPSLLSLAATDLIATIIISLFERSRERGLKSNTCMRVCV